jgi:hypothetical protein
MGFDPNRQMLRHAHFYNKGGLRSFAASAKSNNQREESGRSGYLPEFSVVQTQRMAAVEPKVPDATSLTNDRFYDQT